MEGERRGCVKGRREGKGGRERGKGRKKEGGGKKGSGKGILAIPILVCFRRRLLCVWADSSLQQL